ncbi:MAG: ABC transporter ATP-binding protein [Candidatus Thorarchaeota archaeon]|nr:ABC transporter ATP-binding protein [Candidatus Thorarchaeota archaeon]
MKEDSAIYAVELENISKTFAGGVQANKNITLRIEEGEVHGLLGENGAGKSTLMNILYGLLSQDEGMIRIRGEEVSLRSPHDAIARGIGMVHQHFKLIPTLTVTENVILGLEPIKLREPVKIETEDYEDSLLSKVKKATNTLVGAFRQLMPTDISGAAERIKRIAEENGLNVDPYARIQDISVGLQQRVEIIKTLYRDADILILDEPTSVLTPQEVDELFVTLDKFKKAGRTIILITHKLRESMALCDRITVLRDGALVGTVDKKDTSPQELARMMVGRPVVFTTEKMPSMPGDVVLKIENLHVDDNRGLSAVKGVSLEVRAGEIVGIAGVEGNGQTELVEALAGLRKPRQGRVFIEGIDITGRSVREIREAGISHIPEDRHARGLVLGFSIRDNLALGKHYIEPFATGPANAILNFDSMADHSERLVDMYSIKISDIEASASTLSGGNQQKVVVARELSTNPKLILAAQPTRGLDVGATEFIHKVLINMRDSNTAVLLISAELDEIRNIADRIAVIYDGEIVAFRSPEETDNQELGLLIAGHKRDEVEEVPQQ